MKQIQCVFLAIAILIGAFEAHSAESVEGKDVAKTFYLELSASVNPSTGATVVLLNTGKALCDATGITLAGLQKISADRKFRSLIDAMNTLAQYGWQLDNTYTVTTRGNTTVYWIAKKTVDDVNDLFEGLVK